jgi:RNA polymerase sigma factor (sigma-70 family)
VEQIQDLVAKATFAPARQERIEAFGRLVERFRDMACAYAYSILGDFHLAEDAAQDAFVTAFGQLPQLRQAGAFPGWFRRIVWSACGQLTRRKGLPTVELDAATELQAQQSGPAQAVEQREMRDEVLRAIQELPRPQREVTTLFYVNGYSQRDIAEFLEVPVTTVKNRLNASRRRLKERMMKMVSNELKSSATGPDFVARVRKVLELRKAGEEGTARTAFNNLLESLKALQEHEQYEKVVHEHEKIVRAIKDDASYKDMWWDSYYMLSDSYLTAGKPLLLAHGILSKLPSEPPAEKARGYMDLIGKAAEAFLAAGKLSEAKALAQRALELSRLLDGTPCYRFQRIEALGLLRRVALKADDPRAAKLYLEEIHHELAACEEDLVAACPGATKLSEASDDRCREWFRSVGDTYHNLAHHYAFWGWGEMAEALRLVRRAAELRDFAPTWVLVARWSLAVEGNRQEALAALKKATQDPAWRAFVRKAFETDAEFLDVRKGQEFLALIRN